MNGSIYPRAHYYLLFLFAIAFLAFWPVYFDKLGEVRLNLHMHTLSAMAWMTLLIAQPILALKGRFDLHRKVGKAVYVVAPVFVYFNQVLFHDFLNTQNPFVDQFGLPIFFFDIVGLVYFCLAVTLAVTKYKRQRHIHARLMLSTIVLMLFPVVARVFLFYTDFGLSVSQIFQMTLYLIDALLVILIILEWRQGKVYFVFPLVLAFTLIQHLGYNYATNWPVWQAFANWYAAL